MPAALRSRDSAAPSRSVDDLMQSNMVARGKFLSARAREPCATPHAKHAITPPTASRQTAKAHTEATTGTARADADVIAQHSLRERAEQAALRTTPQHSQYLRHHGTTTTARTQESLADACERAPRDGRGSSPRAAIVCEQHVLVEQGHVSRALERFSAMEQRHQHAARLEQQRQIEACRLELQAQLNKATKEPARVTALIPDGAKTPAQRQSQPPPIEAEAPQLAPVSPTAPLGESELPQAASAAPLVHDSSGVGTDLMAATVPMAITMSWPCPNHVRGHGNGVLEFFGVHT